MRTRNYNFFFKDFVQLSTTVNNFFMLHVHAYIIYV